MGFRREILENGVIVYRSAIPFMEELVTVLKDSPYWEKWYDVGRQIAIPPYDRDMFFEGFPSEELFNSKLSGWSDSQFFRDKPKVLEEYRWMDLDDIFYKVSQDYLNTFPVHDVPEPLWYRGGVNILTYETKGTDEVTTEASGTIDYALPFHTDFHYPTADQEGLKPFLTITMYLNDDYEGGDIEYRIFNKSQDNIRIEGINMIDKDTGETVPGFNYKPKAGDIIVFPSRLPYYHGVKKVTRGQKLFIRTFWMYKKEN
jgi:hypothetical protein